MWWVKINTWAIDMINLRSKINTLLNSQYFEKFILGLIFLNLLSFIISTEPTIYNKFSAIFDIFDKTVLYIFTIEYLLRLCAIRKLKDIFKPLMLIDFVAIAPFYIPATSLNISFIRILRIVRLLRVAKLARYTKALENIRQSFLRKKFELLVTLFIFIAGIIVSSILIYFAENETGVQTFRSVISSLWWAIVTFTSVGYGDCYPITVAGKIIAAISAIMGVCIHGLFIGVIGSAFMEAIENNKHEKEKDRCNT